MEQIKIAYEFINKHLPVELLNLFKLNSDVHSHLARNAANKGLHIPKIYTTSFGEKSLKYFTLGTNLLNSIMTLITLLKKHLSVCI